MKDKAVELFTAVPKQHNCAQAVVCGAGRCDLKDAMATCGGGKAPEGICGAVWGASQLLPEDKREELFQEFQNKYGSLHCSELKKQGITCVDCVKNAAALAEKYFG
ncbi:MAG: C_GCAxxG_C_C family protein [Lentisphaeria bacterium]|nr:C_GCAxxG_C_C family protein [Lentisphaeria bacterium]